MRREASRMPAVDALKATACVLIVLHHLAFYGPMADVAKPLAPGLMDFLFEYARMAVQVFLVTSGFLFAAKFGPLGGAAIQTPLNLLLQRYARLVVPYSAALLLAIACSAVAAVWMDHRSISDPPDLGQLLAHVLLLHDLLDQEALSAGVWYVAIDFQLFALAVLLLWLPNRISGTRPALQALAPLLVIGMTLASLFGFNRDALWGETNTLPLHVEILYNEYNAIGAFAAASILALLALVTLFAKTVVEWRMKKETDMLNTVLAPEKT